MYFISYIITQQGDNYIPAIKSVQQEMSTYLTTKKEFLSPISITKQQIIREKPRKNASLGIIFTIPESVQISRKEPKHEERKKNISPEKIIGKNGVEQTKQEEKKIKKAFSDLKKEKVLNNIIILSNRQKTGTLSQYKNQSSLKKTPYCSLPHSPTFNKNSNLLNPAHEFKGLSILNKTIFASPSSQKKRKSPQPFELSINKLPIVPNQKKKRDKFLSNQFGFITKYKPYKQQHTITYEQSDIFGRRKEKSQLKLDPIQKQDIRGWDINDQFNI